MTEELEEVVEIAEDPFPPYVPTRQFYFLDEQGRKRAFDSPERPVVPENWTELTEQEFLALPSSYAISKTTPWKRMTPEEADIVYAKMQTAPMQFRAIYDAAQYLSSSDELWPTLRQFIITALGSETRTDELLAPEH